MSFAKCSFLLLLPLLLFTLIEADINCLIKGFTHLSASNPNKTKLERRYYSCPDPNLPETFTDCCSDRDQCCPPRLFIFEAM